VVAGLVVGVEFEDGGVAGAEETVLRQLGQLAAQRVAPCTVLVHVHALLQLQERLHVVAPQTTATQKFSSFNKTFQFHPESVNGKKLLISARANPLCRQQLWQVKLNFVSLFAKTPRW
jgi:hypothetical protein